MSFLPCDTGFQPVQSPAQTDRPTPRRINPVFHIYLYLLLSLSTLPFTQGCTPCSPEIPTLKFRRNPPLRSVADVIAAINANNRRIPTLWATLNYSARPSSTGQDA